MKVRTALRTLAVTLVAALMLVVPATAAHADSWQRHYYDNWFKSFFSCIARGEQVIGHRERSQAIYGAKSYVCYKSLREKKYSMDILFEDHHSGGGGGGGGGGGWIIRW